VVHCVGSGRAYLTALPAVRDFVTTRKHPQHQITHSPDQEARVTRWLEIITLIGVYGGLLMPLVFGRVVVYPFVYLKMLYFQILVGVTFGAWATLALRDARYRPRSSWLLWGIVAWYGTMGMSTVFADNSWRAFFGTQERMTGLFSLLHFFAWYLMTSSMLTSSREWRRLLEFQLGVSVALASASILQLFFPTLIGSGDVAEGDRLSGLLGNPIYVGAYQAFSAFFVIFLWREASLRRRSLYLMALATSMVSFALAGSRGPLLGLVVGMALLALIVITTTRHRKLVVAAAVTGTGLVASYVLVATVLMSSPALQPFWLTHGNLGHFFHFHIDHPRLLLWTAAWDGFLSRPILGWGPAGFELAFDALYRPSFHALGLNDEAHNHVLGVMSETGSVGLIAFLAMWVAYFAMVVRTMRKGALTPLASAALFGAGAGHFVQFLFAFETPAPQLVCFLAFSVATAASNSTLPGNSVVAERHSQADPNRWVPFGTIPALMAGVVILGSVLPALSSYYAKRASTALAHDRRDEMVDLLARSQRLATPFRDDQLLVATHAVIQLARTKELEEWSRRKEFLALTNTIADQHFAKNKRHARLRRLYASTLLAIGKTYSSPRVIAKAELLFKQNLLESPRRQRFLLDYARFQAETGHLAEAEALLHKAVALDAAFGEPRWELGKFMWTHLKRADEGSKLMADSAIDYAHFTGITDDYIPATPMEWQQLAQVCSRVGKLDKLRAIVLAVRDFPKTEHRSFEAQLGIARYMEKSGLFAERDEVLKYTQQRNPKLFSLINPVLTGSTTLQAQQVNAEMKAKATASATASNSTSPPPPENQISLARMP